MTSQQQIPDILVPYETTINAPIQDVWGCLADFGGWARWTASLEWMIIGGDGVEKVGCIRKFQSATSGNTYEEKLLEKDNKNFVLKFCNVSSDPPMPFIEYQLVTGRLEALGKDKTAVHYLVRVTPNVQLPEDKIEAFKKLGTKTYDEMFVDMQKYLDQQPKPTKPTVASYLIGLGAVFGLLFAGYSLSKSGKQIRL